MRPKTVASAYVAAAATAPSSSRLRTGSRRTRARESDAGRERRDERRGDGLGRRPRRLRRGACPRRRDVGEHPCLGQRENREPRAAAAERERAGGEHPVGDAPRLHGVPQHGKRAGEWGAVHAERGGERAGDLVDREALAGRDVDDVGGEDVRDRRTPTSRSGRRSRGRARASRRAAPLRRTAWRPRRPRRRPPPPRPDRRACARVMRRRRHGARWRAARRGRP